MQVVEDTLGGSFEDVLDRPLFAFLAQSTDAGPRISPLWFLWADDRLWHVAQLTGRSYPDRVRRDGRVAEAIVDFEPTDGRVEHVGIRGAASLRDFDADRVDRLLAKYLGEDRETWPERFRAVSPDGYALIEVRPDTVVARDQSY